MVADKDGKVDRGQIDPYSLTVLSLFSAKAPDKPIQVVYVPSHLFHMLFELFKVSGI